MRVVVFAEISLAECAGPAVHLAELSSALQRAGAEVGLVVPRLGRYKGEIGCGVAYVPTLRRRGLTRPLFHLLAPFYLIPRILRADVVYTRASYYTLTAALLARILRKPHVAEVNGLFREDLQDGKRGRLVRGLCDLTERLTYRNSETVICVSDGIADTLAQRFDLPSDRFVTIPNGVNAEVFAPTDREKARRDLRLPASAPLAVYVGSLERWQGLDMLADVAPAVSAALPQARFVIVGSGTYAAQMRSAVETKGLGQSFIFAGERPPAECARYIAAADLCLAPLYHCSTSGVGLSLVKPLAYMACGRAVLAFALPGSEYIGRVGGGTLAPPADARAYAEALARMLGDREGCDRMGKKGRRYVLAQRTWERVAQATLDVLSRAVEERG